MRRNCNKQKLLLVFLSIIASILLFSCINTKNSAYNLIGSWHWVRIIKSENALSELAVLYTYKPNGELLHTAAGIVKAGKSIANFQIQGKSKWKIINGYYYEKDEFSKLVSVAGDKVATDIVKDVYSFENVEDKWTKWNITQYDKNAFQIESEDKEEVLKFKRVDGT